MASHHSPIIPGRNHPSIHSWYSVRDSSLVMKKSWRMVLSWIAIGLACGTGCSLTIILGTYKSFWPRIVGKHVYRQLWSPPVQESTGGQVSGKMSRSNGHLQWSNVPVSISKCTRRSPCTVSRLLETVLLTGTRSLCLVCDTTVISPSTSGTEGEEVGKFGPLSASLFVCVCVDGPERLVGFLSRCSVLWSNILL